MRAVLLRPEKDPKSHGEEDERQWPFIFAWRCHHVFLLESKHLHNGFAELNEDLSKTVRDLVQGDTRTGW